MGTQTLSKLNDGKPSRNDVLLWSADGRRVLNSRHVVRGFELEWIATDATVAPTPLTRVSDNAVIVSAAVAPDERTIALGTAFGSGGFNVMLLTVRGDTTLAPFAAADANEITPQFSPDGRWIAYASDESGRYEIYAKPFPGPGARAQISDAGGAEPVWAKDGRRLFYRNGRALIAANVAESDRDGTLAVAKREQLFAGDYFDGSPTRGAAYDVAPDGRHFVMARAVNGSGAQIIVWTGWIGELKKRLAEQK
jgi:hypothetical protein